MITWIYLVNNCQSTFKPNIKKAICLWNFVPFLRGIELLLNTLSPQNTFSNMLTNKYSSKRMQYFLYCTLVGLIHIHIFPISLITLAAEIENQQMDPLPLYDILSTGEKVTGFIRKPDTGFKPVTSRSWSLIERIKNQLKSSHSTKHGHKLRGISSKTKRQKRHSCIGDTLLRKLKDYGGNVVILSSGCSGTLISPRFVLTAAHCVNNGQTSHRNLQVAIQGRTSNAPVHRVKEVIVPEGWVRVGNSMTAARYVNDYAILELATEAEGHREFMPLRAIATNMLTSDMFYMGFFFVRGKPKFSINTCPWETGRTYSNRKLLTRECGAGNGHSGASVFTHHKQGGFRISGIVSHARIVRSPNEAQENTNQVTVITALTQPKIDFICSIVSSKTKDLINACSLGSASYKSAMSNLIY